METMHAAGRRTLPPVPPTTHAAGGRDAATAEQDGDAPTERFLVDLTTGEQRAIPPERPPLGVEGGGPRPSAPADDLAQAVVAGAGAPSPDGAQEFVARLRAAAADFAEAAGAESAVVREAVPPARHRRARCRVVLRYADDAEVDVTFLGPAGRPASPSRHGFDRQIRRWLKAGQRREAAWVVADADAPDGLAVDLSAWVAAA